jgi:hypothetical protein
MSTTRAPALQPSPGGTASTTVCPKSEPLSQNARMTATFQSETQTFRRRAVLLSEPLHDLGELIISAGAKEAGRRPQTRSARLAGRASRQEHRNRAQRARSALHSGEAQNHARQFSTVRSPSASAREDARVTRQTCCRRFFSGHRSLRAGRS